MRIISFIRQNSGPCYHRLIMPLMLMENTDVFLTNNLLEEHFAKGCDVFVYNRILPDHCLTQLAELKKKYGFKICVDVDDYWILDEHHILYAEYEKINFANTQLAQIVAADFVTTSTKSLAEEVIPYNSNVYYIPNAIPLQGQFDIERTASHLTRLFWQGSITHEEDIALLQRPVALLAPLSGKIKMVMGGVMDSDPTWYEMAKDYTGNFKHQYKLLPGAAVTEYYSHYKEADICLVPLLNTRFNRHKSKLKILEAANLSLPVICSNVLPYADMPVIHATGVKEWVTQINRLVASKKRQKEAGQELAEYCKQHFNFFKINKERKQIYESCK